ncbi:MAG: hypothetical protein IPK04_17550 [Bdellovibrionales bacterium]|nr:hypothetical protein [Bdellovibrionales bacterium]
MALFTFKTPDILVQTTNLKEAFFNKGTTNRLMERAVGIGTMQRTKTHLEAIPATAKAFLV